MDLSLESLSLIYHNTINMYIYFHMIIFDNVINKRPALYRALCELSTLTSGLKSWLVMKLTPETSNICI